MSLFVKNIILFISFILLSHSAHTLEIVLENKNIIHIKHNNLDNRVSEVAKSHCSSLNKNTYFFRTKDKKTYDVDLGSGFLFFKNENNRIWRFFCSTNYKSALNLFKNNFSYGDFKSSLINKNFEDIEGVFWRTKTFQVGVEGDDEVFDIFFIGLLLLIVAGYFLDKKIRGNKKSTDLINTKIKKSKTIKKTDEELLSEWNNKRSEL